MKRDMDLVREILLQIEGNPQMDRTRGVVIQPEEFPNRSRGELAFHLKIMAEADLIDAPDRQPQSPSSGPPPLISRGLTWSGCELLETMRDPMIWSRTKEGAQHIGSLGVDTVKALGKGLIKKQVEKWTGVDVDL